MLRIKKYSLLAFATLLLMAPNWAQESTVVPANSKVEFSLKHFTGRAEGDFGKFKGKLNFQKKDPSKSKVSFQVSVPSIDTKNKKRDAHLVAPDYFDAEKFPLMTFESVAFKPVGKGRYKVTGPLTIKGVSKPISISVNLVRDSKLWATGVHSLRFESSFEIDRRDFGVGDDTAFLGNDVRVDLDLEFQDDPK